MTGPQIAITIIVLLLVLYFAFERWCEMKEITAGKDRK